eukprot:scaffold23363_cov180-Skeletonema_marinoi.AAC.6
MKKAGMKEQGLAKRVKLLNNDEVTICLRSVVSCMLLVVLPGIIPKKRNSVEGSSSTDTSWAVSGARLALEAEASKS